MCIHKSHQRKLAWERKRKFNNGMFYGCFVDFLSIKKGKKNTTRCGGRRFMMAPALEKRQLSNWRENKLLLSVVSPITSPRCGVSTVSHGHQSGMTPAATCSQQIVSHWATHPRLKQLPCLTQTLQSLRPQSTP